jgi:ribonucleoside-diphosphate reductase alpha chain
MVANDGSIQNISEIPEDLRQLYRIVWEIPTENQVKLSAARAPFVDQSQSLNIYIETPSASAIRKIHMLAWKLGLKTGQYYLRMKTGAKGANMIGSVPASAALAAPAAATIEGPICKKEDGCVSCSS